MVSEYASTSRNENGSKRAINFTKSEENMLIHLVKKYAYIIENKKTDSCMNQKKNATWAQIATEFNSTGGDTFRSLQILKNKYLNLRKKSLKKFSEEKKAMYGTGGGPPVVCKDTEIDGSIEEIIGSRMTGMTSQFDGDLTVTTGSEYEIPLEIPNEELTVISNENISDHTYFTDEMDVCENPVQDRKNVSNDVETTTGVLNFEQVDWSKNSVGNLRTPVSMKLQVNNPKDVRKRDNTLKSKLSNWAKSKQDFVTVQQQCVSDESKQKLRHNEEKHQMELKHNQEVHEQRLQMMQEEHAINISILRLKKEKLVREMTD